MLIKITKNTFCIFKTLDAVKPTGKLLIIPTPIGNINDLTPNILKGLFRADLIACQDRRVAGQLYTLIKNKNIIKRTQEHFGSIGLSSLILSEEQSPNLEDTQFDQHMFYNYSNMGQKQRRKFLSKMRLEDEKKFKIQYLKYRATKILNKDQDFMYKKQTDKFDQLYGIQVSDFKHIQTQISNTRAKKNRGILIPLNTYSETKMYQMIRHLLQTKIVALVSDAGMPCISDPGWKIIQMIKKSMPKLKIEVIGGPSTVDIMLNLAKITSNGKILTGRFEGFASPQVSNITQQSIKIDKNLKYAKEKDFSIHFINSKKLLKQIYSMEKIYGGEKNILITNELTKKFQRKYHGTLNQLIQTSSNKKNEFQSKGQMSYLLYSNKTVDSPPILKPNVKGSEEDIKKISLPINILKMCEVLRKKTDMKSKQISETITAIFGLKPNYAKKIVYQHFKR